MGNYIADIRKLVGTIPIILVGACVAVFNGNRELLLQYRSDTLDWGLPGGALEIGETMDEAARREMFEETGLDVRGLKLIDVISGSDGYYKYPNGDEAYCVICLYEAEEAEGELRINDGESLDLRYFGLDKLPQLETRTGKMIEKYFRNKF